MLDDSDFGGMRLIARLDPQRALQHLADAHVVLAPAEPSLDRLRPRVGLEIERLCSAVASASNSGVSSHHFSPALVAINSLGPQLIAVAFAMSRD